MEKRPVSNPLIRFREVAVAYDEGDGPPPVKVSLLEDNSKSILASNDSPDVGFKWSVNPYRGCLHACSYCLAGDTRILRGDGRTTRIEDLAVGDEIIGTRVRDGRRRFTRTRVLAHWTTRKRAYRITLADGTVLEASGDHRFLSTTGWRYVMPGEPPVQRPALVAGAWLLGTGAFADTPRETPMYARGYLGGMFRGDAMMRETAGGLTLVDFEGLSRTRRYVAGGGTERVDELIAYPRDPDDAWHKGFLAGLFDAAGTRGEHALRIANTDRRLSARIVESLTGLRFDAVVDGQRPALGRPRYDVRVRGGFREHLRFLHTTGPAVSRKWELDGRALDDGDALRVVKIEPLGARELYDITTGTGDFIANGVVSHNCYARPSHEYLDLGAGTDFDTKIVVKRQAPALLREAFEKKSWAGDLVMFSGVTDCYQAVEKELRITRGCLEVCLEYRNPVSVISKSALVERDLDLFVALAKEARFNIAVSLAFSDDDMARKIEPWAPAPSRRFKVIEKLAAAGLQVGVMCAPIMPGVNDSQMVTVLERAAAAGATQAGWVLLRLPHSVKQVFEERVRIAMPLAADKVLHRIRETRGGDKLYDASFHTRGRGQGPYADAIAQMFDATIERLRLNRRDEEAERGRALPTTFRRPAKPVAQLSLF